MTDGAVSISVNKGEDLIKSSITHFNGLIVLFDNALKQFLALVFAHCLLSIFTLLVPDFCDQLFDSFFAVTLHLVSLLGEHLLNVFETGFCLVVLLVPANEIARWVVSNNVPEMVVIPEESMDWLPQVE